MKFTGKIDTDVLALVNSIPEGTCIIVAHVNGLRMHSIMNKGDVTARFMDEVAEVRRQFTDDGDDFK